MDIPFRLDRLHCHLAGTALGGLLLSLSLAPAWAGTFTIENVSTVDQRFTTPNARNIGSCLALIDAGAQQGRRLLVGAPSSNNPTGQSRVGRTIPLAVLPNGVWDPLFSNVAGSPTGDLNNGYYGYRCAADGDRHVVSQRSQPRVHVYRDGVVEQSLAAVLSAPGAAVAPDAPVTIQGDLVALGMPHDDGNRGRVHLWRRTGTSWQPLQVLSAGAGATVGGEFGGSVALAGELLIIGAPAEATTGRVYVFEFDGSSFQPRGNLALAGNVDTSIQARFGHSLAVDEVDQQYLVVGAPGAKLTQITQRSGSVLAYRFNAANPARWDLLYALQPPDFATSTSFGTAVALRERHLLTSDPALPASFGQASSTGVVYRYRFSPTMSAIEALQRLFRSTGGPDNFGWSLAFSDDAVAIGAPNVFTANSPDGNVYRMGANRLLIDGFE